MEIQGFDETMVAGLDEAALQALAVSAWEAFLAWVRIQPDAARLFDGLEVVSLVSQGLAEGDALEERSLRAALDAAEWLGALACSQGFGVTAWFFAGGVQRFREVLAERGGASDGNE